MSRYMHRARRGGWRFRHPPDRVSRRENSVGFLVAAAAAPTTSAVPSAAVGAAAGREAVGAVNRLISTRLEWHLSVLAALGAHGREHLSLPSLVSTAGRVSSRGIAASAPARLVGRPALGASARLVGEALLCEELLLSLREGELAVAVAAGEGLVLHVDYADSHLGLYLERFVSAIESVGERSEESNHNCPPPKRTEEAYQQREYTPYLRTAQALLSPHNPQIPLL